MGKKRLGNLFKRELSLNFKKIGDRWWDLRKANKAKEEGVRSQLRDFSRLGGELIVMKMGS